MCRDEVLQGELVVQQHFSAVPLLREELHKLTVCGGNEVT